MTANMSSTMRPDPTNTPMSFERFLPIARPTWVLITLLTIGLLVKGIPARYNELVASVDHRALSNFGINGDAYAVYLIALGLGVVGAHILIAAVIFWQCRHEWIALFGAITLVTNGALVPLAQMYAMGNAQSAWHFLANIVIAIGLFSSVALLYRFPDGQLVPSWTRWLAPLWGSVVIFAVFFPNTPLSLPRWNTLAQFAAILFWTGSGVYAQTFRYRYVSVPIQRQQAKWAFLGLTAAVLGPFAYFIPFVMLTSLTATSASNFFFQRIGSGFFAFSLGSQLIGATILHVGLILFPLSLAIAIMRYRLWDIDIIIRRTLIYAALTAWLALIYFTSVILLEQISRAFTGQQRSEIITVISTLGIAALFNPLRRRVQDAIDRRFYRRKYDAERVLAAFSATMRDQVELEKLTARLMQIADETMQPAHVSVWLRKRK
ncbi:hypothetical protein ANRL1_03302 [Anaerolineae bacterium]|nr:hypothetical protein ANRL1_03302 [Anaerolineae bacterium]